MSLQDEEEEIKLEINVLKRVSVYGHRGVQREVNTGRIN